MDIITGYTGEAHILSDDDAALNSAIFGNGNLLLDYGEKFAETHDLSTNSITIQSGDLLIGGRHARIRTGDAETFQFTAVGSGQARKDCLFVCYKKTIAGIESAYLEYVEGTDSAYPSEPTIDTTAADFQYYTLYGLYFKTDGTVDVLLNGEILQVESVSTRIKEFYPTSGTNIDSITFYKVKGGGVTWYVAKKEITVALNANSIYVFTLSDIPSVSGGSVNICARAATTEAGVYSCYQTVSSTVRYPGTGTTLAGLKTGSEAVTKIEVNYVLFKR